MRFKLLAASASLLTLTALGNAQLLYDNSPPDQSGGNEMTEWLQAENFTLGADATVGSITFWTWELTGTNNYDGSGQWWIFADAGGSPGAEITSGSGSPTRSLVGDLGNGFTEYMYEFDIADTAVAGGVDYWLGLPLKTNFDTRWDMYWENTSSGHSPTGHESDRGTMDNWADNGAEHAFQMYGPVPEPSTFIGLGVLGALALIRRRR
jgi:hypothetical protein